MGDGGGHAEVGDAGMGIAGVGISGVCDAGWLMPPLPVTNDRSLTPCRGG